MLPHNSEVARMSACELEVFMIRRWLREGVKCWLCEGVKFCSDVVARGCQFFSGCGCARASTLVGMWLREGVNSCSDVVAR